MKFREIAFHAFQKQKKNNLIKKTTYYHKENNLMNFIRYYKNLEKEINFIDIEK